MYPAHVSPEISISNILKSFSPTTLHAMVVRFPQTVDESIQQKLVFKARFNTHESTYRLTALHVAVLEGKWKIVENLVKAGGSLLEVDYNGNTPAHLAAITGNWEMVEKLKVLAHTLKQDFSEVRNVHYGTVADLRKITLPPAAKPSDVVVLMKNGNGEIAPMTQAEYQKRTGTLYCDYPQVTSAQLTKHWCAKEDERSYPGVADLWSHYCKQKPKVYLEEQVIPETNAPVGLGVRVGEEILPETLLFPWGGEWIADPESEGSDLRMGNIECLINSNIACRVNDGFPNAITIPLPVEGAPCGTGVVTIGRIAKDAILTINYGGHGCKFGRYGFFYQKEMEEYCKVTDFKAQCVKMAAFMRKRQDKGGSISAADQMQLGHIAAKEIYLLETPRALVHLAARSLLTVEKIENLLKLDKSFRQPPDSGENKVLADFAEGVLEFLKGLDNCDPLYKKTFLAHIDKLFAKHNVVSGIMILNYFHNTFISDEIFEKQPNIFEKNLNLITKLANILDLIIDAAPHLLDEAKQKEAAEMICVIQKQVHILTPDILANAVALKYNKVTAMALLKILGVKTP